ncbi:MAG: hypothetical protein AAF500_20840 [Myxococcota bacterium]
MHDALPLIALLSWQVVMMGGLRAGRLSAPNSPRALAFTMLGVVGFAASCLVAFRIWPPTVAFWWWVVAWMVSALLVVWVGAYLRAHGRTAPFAILGVAVIGGLTTWGLP